MATGAEPGAPTTLKQGDTMNTKIFYLIGRLAEMDANIPDGELTWTEAVKRALVMQGRVPAPQALIQAVAIGLQIEESRKHGLEIAAEVIEQRNAPIR